ncbi:hypothetical protein TRVL_01084 [Trypanosoma vivax]|nr:hypothetical protein TRVL_01084 [Trypanosoma vivax]
MRIVCQHQHEKSLLQSHWPAFLIQVHDHAIKYGLVKVPQVVPAAHISDFCSLWSKYGTFVLKNFILTNNGSMVTVCDKSVTLLRAVGFGEFNLMRENDNLPDIGIWLPFGFGYWFSWVTDCDR